jgi:hypothetical protein
MSKVIHKTADELREQRERLLLEAKMSYAQLQERAATYSLSADELDIWHTIEGIDYVLKSDS